MGERPGRLRLEIHFKRVYGTDSKEMVPGQAPT